MQEDKVKNGCIYQLPPLVANQIAAGEVVERPASVVKELVENSIDAGATKIEVQVEGGGIHLIRVRDNGCGMVKSDLALAFSRHATSKLQSVEDLFCVQSLGFRGEALASIASVSRCRLMSRMALANHAWEITIGADLAANYHIVSHPVGTTIEVADLFYNTPVRRKFLKREKTEFQAIVDVISRLALSYPEIGFSLEDQQKKVCHYPAVSSLLSETARVGKICGQAFMTNSFFVNMQAVGLSLKAWIGKPTLARRLTDCQYFFVNRRMVKDRLLNHAIRTLYHQHPQMLEGTCPSYVLHLTISPEDVDVNVHPTKQEVRFSQPRLVHDFITQCVLKALDETTLSPSDSVLPDKAEQVHTTQMALYPFSSPKLIQKSVQETQGRMLHRYFVKEDNEGLILVDLHKAKNELLSAYFQKNWGSLLTKKLLFPLRIKQDNNAAAKNRQQLEQLGFYFSQINKNQLSLCQVPSIVKDPIENLLDFLHGSLQSDRDKPALCDHLAGHLSFLSLSQIPEDEFASLITYMMTSGLSSSWLKLNHEDIALRMEAAV